MEKAPSMTLSIAAASRHWRCFVGSIKKGFYLTILPRRLRDNRRIFDLMFLRAGVMNVTTANNKR